MLIKEIKRNWRNIANFKSYKKKYFTEKVVTPQKNTKLKTEKVGSPQKLL